MEIRTEVRKVEKHIKEMGLLSKSEQVAIISKAQSLALGDEHSITVLAIVKNRIIHS